MNGRRDVFIAHAFHDKEEFVRPLSTALGRHAVSCWVDEGQIGPGDSLIDAMNAGLSTSRYIAVVITDRFLAAQWAPRELNAALQLEVRKDETIVLPIVAVRPEALEQLPLLLDKRWLVWSEGPEHLAAEIGALFERPTAKDWHVDPPESYVGRFWARAVAAPAAVGQPHEFTFRWGPYLRRVVVDRLGPEPLSLLFHKTQPDRVLLHVEVKPAAVMTFGAGGAPDPQPLVIDEGWERSAGWNFPAEQGPMGDSQNERERLVVQTGREPSRDDGPGPSSVFHVRVSRYLIGAETFNLSAEQLSEQFLAPWREGRPIFLRGRLWDPAKTRITVYEGNRLTSQQRSLGLGWSKAVEFGENVTDQLLRAAISRD